MTSVLCLLAAMTLGGDDQPISRESEETQAKLRQIFDDTAKGYEITLEGDAKVKLKLVEKATYTWARAGANVGSLGSVYVWTNQGNAEAVACFWRWPASETQFDVVHELHSLSAVRFQAERPHLDAWKPQAGVKRMAIPGAPAPASTSGKRLQQMRTLCRDFSAHSVGDQGERTELRLLPQPLHRSQSTNPKVVDGALFAYVCSVGTDPEAFLLLEAVQTAQGAEWQYALARFSHMDLFVHHKDREVWKSVHSAENVISHNPDKTYWVDHERFDNSRLDAVDVQPRTPSDK